MTAGIFNPYVPKKKKFKASTDMANPLLTELPNQALPRVTLHTGAFSLNITVEKYEEVPDKLGLLIKHLTDNYKEHLLQNGVSLIPRSELYQSDAAEATLPTSNGVICVYVGEITSSNTKDTTTDKAYQRISHMLYTLQNPALLDRYGVAVNRIG